MTTSELEVRLRDALIRDWGYVVGSAGLRQVLGFSTQAALRHAIARGALPVTVFEIEGRKGHFALAHDLAAWLAAQTSSPSTLTTGQRGGVTK
jgi:hypothetical protein